MRSQAKFGADFIEWYRPLSSTSHLSEGVVRNAAELLVLPPLGGFGCLHRHNRGKPPSPTGQEGDLSCVRGLVYDISEPIPRVSNW